ncbi:signal peptidase I [Neobacillus sp. LXY-4]|uniref:signal peptidase I n=1 Tax=Neobacillus sp. LXY-4 TaxID=3379826 RepID=UPI003EE031C0
MSEKIMNEIIAWVKLIAIAFLIAFLFRQFLFTPTTVFGESMSPTFQEKDRVIISKTADIQRFDVIVFDAPDADEYYIKRVIGLPGDHIKMEDDVLYINGKAVNEPYLKERKKSPFIRFTGNFSLKELTGVSKVPKDSIFVMGDNRLHSKDSRYFGFVSIDSVIGEVKFQFFPIDDIGITK